MIPCDLVKGTSVSEEPAVSSFRVEGGSSRFSDICVYNYRTVWYVIQKTVTSTSDNLRSHEEVTGGLQRMTAFQYFARSHG
jgi:hypothetical protein